MYIYVCILFVLVCSCMSKIVPRNFPELPMIFFFQLNQTNEDSEILLSKSNICICTSKNTHDRSVWLAI